MADLLQQLLETSARIYPDQTAVIHKNNAITYQELQTVSSQLAHRLRSAGIHKGDRVGIYLNKSIEAVVAIFGILKAGAVYVPLDPLAPVKRIASMVENCTMKALVSTEAKITNLRPALSDTSGVQCLVLMDKPTNFEVERFSPTIRRGQAPTHDEPTPDDPLAYILYTSGSTGVPKGVMISHRAALTFVNWSYECFGVHESDRVSNHAPLHFDLSIFDIFTTIKAGATLILIGPELSVFPLNLANFIAKQRITIWYSVPSVLTGLVVRGNLQPHQFPELRTVLFAGEVFPVKYLRQLMEKLPQAKFYNLYGPTETNVCTYYQVDSIAPEQTEPVPIGKAISNTEVFIINQSQEIARPGEVGELYVRGSSLMTGYWGMPEKTQAVLVRDPVGCDRGSEKVYRTGDLVKQRPDGNYVYLGRSDRQIKSRGYRIELGEIEAALYGHVAVEEVAIIPIPDEQIGNHIKAIIVTREGIKLNKSELASFCAQFLPKYMHPGIIEFRDFLPKTSTGKIDRNLLLKEHFQKNTNS